MFIEVDRPGVQRLLAGEGQHSVGERSCAGGRTQRSIGVAQHRVGA